MEWAGDVEGEETWIWDGDDYELLDDRCGILEGAKGRCPFEDNLRLALLACLSGWRVKCPNDYRQALLAMDSACCNTAELFLVAVVMLPSHMYTHLPCHTFPHPPTPSHAPSNPPSHPPASHPACTDASLCVSQDTGDALEWGFSKFHQAALVRVINTQQSTDTTRPAGSAAQGSARRPAGQPGPFAVVLSPSPARAHPAHPASDGRRLAAGSAEAGMRLSLFDQDVDVEVVGKPRKRRSKADGGKCGGRQETVCKRPDGVSDTVSDPHICPFVKAWLVHRGTGACSDVDKELSNTEVQMMIALNTLPHALEHNLSFTNKMRRTLTSSFLNVLDANGLGISSSVLKGRTAFETCFTKLGSSLDNFLGGAAAIVIPPDYPLNELIERTSETRANKNIIGKLEGIAALECTSALLKRQKSIVWNRFLEIYSKSQREKKAEVAKENEKEQQKSAGKLDVNHVGPTADLDQRMDDPRGAAEKEGVSLLTDEQIRVVIDKAEHDEEKWPHKIRDQDLQRKIAPMFGFDPKLAQMAAIRQRLQMARKVSSQPSSNPSKAKASSERKSVCKADKMAANAARKKEKDKISAEKKAAKEEEKKKKAGEKAVAGKGRVNKKKRASEKTAKSSEDESLEDAEGTGSSDEEEEEEAEVENAGVGNGEVIIMFSCMPRCIHTLAFCVAGAPSNEEFEIEKVVKERGTGAKRSYLIKWKGWPVSDNTWEPEKIVPRIYLLRYRGEPTKTWPWFSEWELAENETGDVIVQGAIHGKVGRADGETSYTSAISEGVVREDADGKFVATLSGSYYSLEKDNTAVEKDKIAAEKKAAKRYYKDNTQTDDDEEIEPTKIEIVEGDLINDANKAQRIADAYKEYQALKDKSLGRMKPVRDAKRKANIGLKSYNAWCKNPGSRHSRVGEEYTCPGFWIRHGYMQD